MDILLIHPGMSTKTKQQEPGYQTLAPLSLAVLATITPPEHSVMFVDDRLDQIPWKAKPDLVGITTTTDTAKRAYEIAESFRQRGIPVILGGHHATLLPKEAKKHADAVVIGEAEGSWERVLTDFEKGGLKDFYDREQRAEGDEIASPDLSLFGGNRYPPVSPIETTRGCPFQCSFCSVSKFFGPVYRHKPVSRVIEEVRKANKKIIFFVDDNIVGDPSYAKELFRGLEPLNIRWFGQASITMAQDEQLLTLMKKSGCLGNLIGFETIEESTLKEINKGWNLNVPYEEAIRRIHNHGLAIFASFVFGFDKDTNQSIKETLEFSIHSRFLAAQFNVLAPLPATETYEKLKSQDRLVQDKWWLHQLEGQAKFYPTEFSPRKLALETVRAGKQFYGSRSIWSRALNWRGNADRPTKLLMYIVLNHVFRNRYQALCQSHTAGATSSE